LLAEDDAEKLLDLPLRIPLDTSFKNICFDNVYHNMFSDKKNRNGKLQFVLPLSIGETAINVEAPREQVYSALESMLRTIS
jgi:3-dehydroquinate synthetase